MMTMREVADWQLAQPGWDSYNSWKHGALFAGVMATYRTTLDPEYYNAAVSWANKYDWQLGPVTRLADDHCPGQTYLELHFIEPDPNRVQDTKSTFDYLMANPEPGREEWYWCDALFMAPPVLTRLYAVTADSDYLSYLNQMYWDTTEYLYDTDEHLFYRDDRYFDDISPNGEKLFWSRGNGWVLAGLARILQYLPPTDPNHADYITLFQEMSAKIATLQSEDGLWRSNLLDPEHYPDPETSGTGFFCYAIAWGVNEEILDENIYSPIIDKAWEGLTDAVHESGKLGWVQQTAREPGPTTWDSTEIYGVGAFLLAGSEVAEYYLTGISVENYESYVDTDTGDPNLLGTWSHGAENVNNDSNSEISLQNDPNMSYGKGRQSMRFEYDNSVSPFYSAVERAYQSNQDWSGPEAVILSIWLKGDPANAAEQIYVGLEDADGHIAVQRFPEDSITRLSLWAQLNFDIGEFTGVDRTRIRRIIIGIGKQVPEAGGQGAVYIDEIKLQPSQCFPERRSVADFDGDCVVGSEDLKIIAGDWLDGYDNYVQAVVPDVNGLAALYDFENSDAGDSSGHGYHGMAAGVVFVDSDAPVPGGSVKTAGFGGGAGDRIEIPTTSLSLSSGTISLWGYLSETQSGVRYFFGHTSSPPWGDRIQLYMDSDDTYLALGFGDSHSVNTNIATLNIATWYHIALTWQQGQTIGGGSYTVYVNGVEKAKGSYSGLTTLAPLANIGNDGSANPEEALSGYIDHVCIYDYALSHGEILTLAGLSSWSVPLSSPADLHEDGIVNLKDYAILAEMWLQDQSWPN
jgi:rhamnogalacturonyl hydrolase YesR